MWKFPYFPLVSQGLGSFLIGERVEKFPDIKVPAKDSGLAKDLWIGPIYNKITPRSLWRIYWGGDRIPFSFSKNSLKPWGGPPQMDDSEIRGLQDWVSLNYDNLVRIFDGGEENFVNQVKKELRRI